VPGDILRFLFRISKTSAERSAFRSLIVCEKEQQCFSETQLSAVKGDEEVVTRVPTRVASPGLFPSQSHTAKSHAALFVLLGLAIFVAHFSRSPEVLLKPQFWAEDGEVFYQQAHEVGFLHSVLTPHSGYVHLFPRLIAGLSLFLPLSFVPLFFNLAALAVQCLPAIYICTPRMENLGPFRVRLLLAFLCFGIFGVHEVWGNLPNSQWQIALLSFLILIASPPRSRLGTWFDRVALSIGALTGPYCVLLLPIAAIVAFYRRSSRTITQFAILGVGAVAQTVSLLIVGRPNLGNLGASFPLFCKLVVIRGFVPDLPASMKVARVLHIPLASSIFSCCFVIAALAVTAWIFRHGSLEMRCALLFTAMMLAASLASPVVVGGGGEQWPTMMMPGVGERYWFIPRLMIVVAVLWIATQRVSKWARAVGAAMMLAILISCVVHWHIVRAPGIYFDMYVHVFDALPVGAQLRIPINPPPWAVQLTKKATDREFHDPAFLDGEVVGLNDWRNRFQGGPPKESSAAMTGGIITVNGASVSQFGAAADVMHVPARDGALLEGWALLRSQDEFTPMDEVFAITSDQVLKGHTLPIWGFYEKQKLENVIYLVFLPSIVLHPGLQEVTIVGYSRSDKALHSYQQHFYVYGD